MEREPSDLTGYAYRAGAMHADLKMTREHLQDLLSCRRVGEIKAGLRNRISRIDKFLAEIAQADQRRAEQQRACPTCGSPDPARHPAVQHEGEVQICRDRFHSPVPAMTRPITMPQQVRPRRWERYHSNPRTSYYLFLRDVYGMLAWEAFAYVKRIGLPPSIAQLQAALTSGK